MPPTSRRSSKRKRSKEEVRRIVAASLRKRCSNFATDQRGPTCFMAAATLIVGRCLLNRIEKSEIRNYILHAQGQDWESAHGDVDDHMCPRLPSSIRTYYERMVFYMKNTYARGELLEHKTIYRSQRMMGVSFKGGHAAMFTSSILWAAFGKAHAHIVVSEVPIPTIGEEVVITRPKDVRLDQTGVVEKVDVKRKGAMIRFADSERPEALRFQSFATRFGVYPIPFPPDASSIPKTCNTLMTTVTCHIPFHELASVLATLQPYGSKSGYTVLAVILHVRKHVIASFPCLTGWIFCNTWKHGSSARCQTLPELAMDLLRLKDGTAEDGVLGLSILYRKR